MMTSCLRALLALASLGVCVDVTFAASDVIDQLDVENVLELLEELQREQKDLRSVSQLEKEAEEWLDLNDEELRKRMHQDMLVSWAYDTDVTEENELAMTESSIALAEWRGERIEEAKKFVIHVDTFRNQSAARMLRKWVYGNSIPTPNDKDVLNKIHTLSNQLSTIYASASAVRGGQEYRIEPEFINLMATSRDYDELTWAWQAWRDVTGPVMRPKFSELVENMNTAATDNGLSDIGEAWRTANYEDDGIEQMADDLFEKILPLYQQLHAYVRGKLADTYGDDRVNRTGMIPAQLLGNMWAQEWDNIYDLVMPYPESASYDVTDAMLDQGYTVDQMFRTAEEFFTSIGLDPMTDAFWDRSMLVRPEDGRDVQCHGSAQDFLTQDDFRIKMCTEINMNYLHTVHHEMGHVEYFMMYKHQPTVFREGANSAFHEAVGDTIGLSVSTPAHLRAIGLLEDQGPGNPPNKRSDKSESESEGACENQLDPEACREEYRKRINFLMQMALSKVSFLPFGYLIDKWRWEVFRGNIDDSNYNSKWWELRENYQGVVAPVPRSESDFDPGAKFHVANSVPYIRYFLSFIGQFQFQKALCDAAGHQGPLNECDIYQSLEAGKLLRSALESGSSKPWRDVMQSLTGSREFKADAIYDYFRPLVEWLKTQNQNTSVGW